MSYMDPETLRRIELNTLRESPLLRDIEVEAPPELEPFELDPVIIDQQWVHMLYVCALLRGVVPMADELFS